MVVAHRLRTVIQSHTLVALAGGKLMECGTPAALLEEQPRGVLASLVADHGAEEAGELKKLAREAAARR